MKVIIVLGAILFWTSTSYGQITVEISKTKKVTANGVEVTTFEGKSVTGFLVESYPNGKPKSWKTVKDGIMNGLWQEWYENGKLKFNAYWLGGKGHGLWEYYHENGVLRQEEFYNLDIPIGIFRVFHDNGQLKSKTSWLNGKKHGIWTTYNELGILLKTEIYEDNKLISITEK
jgi:antitoxin component YwqK of YwqJK toxin-antitoxin module